MTVSNFDPSAFLDTQITEPSVKRNPIPAGTDVVAVIGEPKMRAWQGKADPSKSGIACDVPLEIDLSAYPDLATHVGLPKITLNDSIMLDTTDDGQLDMAPGRNGKLRRYREALDMNSPGQPFSFRAMQGRMIKVKVKHRTYEGEIYDDVDSVAKA
jgi:hypothetical protein